MFSSQRMPLPAWLDQLQPWSSVLVPAPQRCPSSSDHPNPTPTVCVGAAAQPLLWGSAPDTLSPWKAHRAPTSSCLQSEHEPSLTRCRSDGTQQHMALCRDLLWNKESKALLLLHIKSCHSAPGGLSLSHWPKPISLHGGTPTHTHTHTHSPRPKTWNFYKEQDTWELAKSHGATSINPPRLLLFSKADQEARGPGWATSCPREKSMVKSVSPLILRHPAQTLRLKPHFPTNHLYTVLFLLTLSKNSVWLPSHCDSLFRIEDSPPPFHLCSKGPLQTLSKPQPPQARVIRHWNTWWCFHGIFECNRPFSPDWKKEACGAVAGYHWAKVERQNP